MRRSVSAFAAIVLVSGACSGFASTRADSKKTHAKTQAEHVSKTDHTVPATPTLKDVPHVKAEDRIDPTAPANLGSTTPASGKGCPGGGSRLPFHIKRSQSARAEFMRNSGYADGRKGYTVDYFTPLECGGSDTPDNMQWKPVDFTAAGKTASTHP